MGEVLADFPWPPLVARFELEIAAGHVEPNRIAEHQIERVGLAYLGAFTADGDHQFSLEMTVGC